MFIHSLREEALVVFPEILIPMAPLIPCLGMWFHVIVYRYVLVKEFDFQ